jgi:hypothetical protein
MPLDPFMVAGAAAGALGGLYKIGQGIHQNNLAKKVVVPGASYTSSPYAASMLEEARRIKNSAQPGMASATRNILGNEGNTTAAINRNATSGSQALALLSASEGNTNQAFNQLDQNQNQWQESTLNNFNNANLGMINEGDKVYQDAVRKRQEAIAEKNALRGAGAQNTGGAINDLANNAFFLASVKNKN